MSLVELPEAFQPLFTPARFKAYYGGRGSAKSYSFASALIIQAVKQRERILCGREVQKSIKESVKQLLDDRIRAMGLGGYFHSTETEIIGPNESKFLFTGLREHTVDTLKSKEGITKCWIEEAHSVSQKSLNILIPTIREEGSELWFSWNPTSEYDPVDQMFRGKHVPPNSIVRKVSWRDNPWFPEVLREAMEFDRRTDAGKAAHIWDGDYEPAPEGSYYGGLLAKAMSDGRIGWVPHDPGLEVHVSFDLGVGQNMSLWFTQWLGREVRWIDYLEGNEEAADEGLSWFARRLREKPYTYAPLLLPHDGKAKSIATGKSAKDVLEGLGFKVDIVPDIGVNNGIQALKRLIPMSWIDSEKCAPGLKPLRAYRENIHETRMHSMGPLKDWTSHAADSARYTAVAYEAPEMQMTIDMGTGDTAIGDRRVNY